MRYREKLIAVVVIVAWLIICCPPVAKALFGVGDTAIVWDPSNWVQNMLQVFYTAEEVSQTVQIIQNQVLMLERMALQVKQLQFSAVPIIGEPLATLQRIYDNAQQIFFNAALIQENFKELYQPFHVQAWGGAEFFAKGWDWNQAVRDAHWVAMQQQAAVPHTLEVTIGAMDSTLAHSEAATGELQALQAGNQALGIVSSQLSTLNTLIATQAQAQATRDMMEAAARDQAMQNGERWLQDFAKVTPTQGLTSLPVLH